MTKWNGEYRIQTNKDNVLFVVDICFDLTVIMKNELLKATGLKIKTPPKKKTSAKSAEYCAEVRNYRRNRNRKDCYEIKS